MKRHTVGLVVCLASVGSLCITSEALGQAARRDAGNQEVLVKFQAMVRQANGERDEALAENAKLQTELTSLKKKLDGVQGKLAATEKHGTTTEEALERYKQSDAALRERLQQQNDKIQQIVNKYKELVASLRQVESDRAEARSMMVSQAKEIDQCVEKNLSLYQTGMELIDRYDNKGVWASLMQREPLTGIQRVKMENAVQDYKLRLHDSKLAVSETH
jgi:chromosome segregation ATPase